MPATADAEIPGAAAADPKRATAAYAEGGGAATADPKRATTADP